jgi:hypothetical protein
LFGVGFEVVDGPNVTVAPVVVAVKGAVTVEAPEIESTCVESVTESGVGGIEIVFGCLLSLSKASAGCVPFSAKKLPLNDSQVKIPEAATTPQQKKKGQCRASKPVVARPSSREKPTGKLFRKREARKISKMLCILICRELTLCQKWN